MIPAVETNVAIAPEMAAAGKLLFESKLLSADKSTACASCHLDRFGSADGLPNAIGVGGLGTGIVRAQSPGEIIPRNTLPFWGRGGKGFEVFFWDGKVQVANGAIKSQFAGEEPTTDPLVVAVHLPPAELGEMLGDIPGIEEFETETVSSAGRLFETLTARVLDDASLAAPLERAFARPKEEIRFLNIAEAIAAFIRSNFRLKETKFEKFVFGSGQLTQDELAGGILFYGKGRCASCHNGPYFSDFKFHAIPFGQLGFGKNGFGIDYGRYNVTLNSDDRYKFRTPPLFNVSKTTPYSHSGSEYDLFGAIVTHTDPLSRIDPQTMTKLQRTEFYERLARWSQDDAYSIDLADDEIQAIATFLGTLEYESDALVISE